jgi:hypothetical protein
MSSLRIRPFTSNAITFGLVVSIRWTEGGDTGSAVTDWIGYDAHARALFRSSGIKTREQEPYRRGPQIVSRAGGISCGGPIGFPLPDSLWPPDTSSLPGPDGLLHEGSVGLPDLVRTNSRLEFQNLVSLFLGHRTR